FPGKAVGVSISSQAPSAEVAPVKEAAKVCIALEDDNLHLIILDMMLPKKINSLQILLPSSATARSNRQKSIAPNRHHNLQSSSTKPRRDFIRIINAWNMQWAKGESKRKLEELLQKWSEWHTRHRSSARTLMEDEPEKYQSRFSEYIKAGVDPENIEELYKKVHSAIRSDPTPKKFNLKKLTYEEKKEKLIEKLNALNAAASGADDE
ncbi:hypothetical protein Ccrd_014682, partial [Cynara cardunculus var. scolymus]